MKILIAGEGGQGVQTIAKILSTAAYFKGKESLFVPNFGVEQRGGVSIAFVQINNQPIPYPKFAQADLLVVLSQRSVKRVSSYIGKDTLVIFNSSLIHNQLVNRLTAQPIPVEATTLAIKKLDYRVFNMIILGVMLSQVPEIDLKNIKKAINYQLGYKFKKNPELRKLNLKALEIGRKLTK
ncbi:MAG TPA: ketoisovalerate oxidoreductase [Candidatus Portnoybacteria bacterium]|nr:ketoisovalerate oxidoreductase [Candidatus Portnoybacteria bacterium]